NAASSAIKGTNHAVIAVFPRSFYLASGTGELACLGPRGLGAGPLNLLCESSPNVEWPALGLAPGATASRDGARLRIGEVLTIDREGAAMWRPAPLGVDWRREDLAAGLAALAEFATANPPRDGFGPWLPVLALGRLPYAEDGSSNLVLRLAQPGIE